MRRRRVWGAERSGGQLSRGRLGRVFQGVAGLIGEGKKEFTVAFFSPGRGEPGLRLSGSGQSSVRSHTQTHDPLVLRPEAGILLPVVSSLRGTPDN